MSDVTYAMRENSMLDKIATFMRRFGWWALFIATLLYSVYAIYMAGVEIGVRLGVTIDDAPVRNVSIGFIIHALSGGIVLVSGALQFNRQLRTNRRIFHRRLGRIYVVMVWLSSIGGLWISLYFDVTILAKVTFGTAALLWFGATTFALKYARKRKFKLHREWMFRSYALSLFFITFSFWADGLTSILPTVDSYHPLIILLSWNINLLVAELWVRRSRTSTRNPQYNGGTK